MSNKTKKLDTQIATAISTVFWILGFGLTFIVPANSTYFWVSDALLLLGFWPYLWLLKASWLWILFGLLNAFIGFVLQLVAFLPDIHFTKEMIVVKTHLIKYHSPLVWILMAILSVSIGLVLTLVYLVHLVYRKIQEHQ